MPSGHSSEVKFEIGHVLFIDIVGYSKLLITEQSNPADESRLIRMDLLIRRPIIKSQMQEPPMSKRFQMVGFKGSRLR